jgi:superfamily I DNA and RNA helicase
MPAPRLMTATQMVGFPPLSWDTQRGSSILAIAPIAGPLLVIAGAGTGKTNTLAHRVAHLILMGTPPDRILLLTFSRRAVLTLSELWDWCILGFCL